MQACDKIVGFTFMCYSLRSCSPLLEKFWVSSRPGKERTLSAQRDVGARKSVQLYYKVHVYPPPVACAKHVTLTPSTHLRAVSPRGMSLNFKVVSEIWSTLNLERRFIFYGITHSQNGYFTLCDMGKSAL